MIRPGRRRRRRRRKKRERFRNSFGGRTCYEEFTLPRLSPLFHHLLLILLVLLLLLLLRHLVLVLVAAAQRAGNCAPPQDVVKPDGSLFPASIILVLDYPDSITRTPSLRVRTARIYMYLPHTYLVITIPAAVSASTAESLGELRPGVVVKNRKKY